MAGITKAERDRRREHAETCDHPRERVGRRWYRYRDGYGKRVTCLVCRAWWVVDQETYQRLYGEPYEDEAHTAAGRLPVDELDGG